MRVAVIDTETTGDGELDQVIEFAARLLDERVIPYAMAHVLVRPTVPITVEARAVHHITDSELDECGVTQDQALYLFRSVLSDVDAVAAHSAEFDVRLLRQTWPDLELPPVIDTWRCARHLWPDAPRFSNQVLRYWLGVDVEPSGTPHRAPYDATVTAALLERMLATHSAEELIALTSTPVLLLNCTIGEYRGQPWSQVPISMLEWICSKEFGEDELHTARHWLSNPDREPVLLPTCRFGAFRDKPWTEVRADFMQWIVGKGTFDADTVHTARHHLALREAG